MFSLCCSFLSTTIVEFRPRLLQSNVAPTSLACPGESHLHGFAYDHPSNKELWHEGSWHDVFRTHIPPVTHAVTNFRKTTKQMVGRVCPMTWTYVQLYTVLIDSGVVGMPQCTFTPQAERQEKQLG